MSDEKKPKPATLAVPPRIAARVRASAKRNKHGVAVETAMLLEEALAARAVPR